MMTEKSQGIVLRQVRYGDTSVICKIFTREHGLKSFMIKGGLKPKSGKQSLLQPFTPVNLSFRNKDNTSLHFLSEIGRAFPLNSIPFDVRKSTIAIFLDEVVYRTLSDDYINRDLFDFIYQFIELLDLSENPVNYHLYFLVRLTGFYGFFPRTETEGRYFDLSEGLFTNQNAGKPTFDEEQTAALRTLINAQPSELENLRFNSNTRQTLLRGLMDYFSFHLDHWKPIKSLSIFEAVFH